MNSGQKGQALPQALALVLVWALGCSDDDGQDSTGDAGSAGAGGSMSTAGAAGSTSGGAGGAGGGLPMGGASGAAGNGGGGLNGTSGSGGGMAGASNVGLDAGTGIGDDDAGGAGASEIQRCETETSCLEFRGHSELCQEGNSANCPNVVGGTYSEGPCPLDQYEFTEAMETFCGPTALFLRIDP